MAHRCRETHCLRVDGVQLQRCAALALSEAHSAAMAARGVLRGSEGRHALLLHFALQAVLLEHETSLAEAAAQFASAFTLARISETQACTLADCAQIDSYSPST